MNTQDSPPGRNHDHPAGATLSLAGLTEQAGVSVRTVRYYIAEGLLPPPVAAGRQSAYTPGHLDRLRLIARLKEAYLPLREIRRQLAGLDDAAVRHLLARDAAEPPAPTDAAAPPAAALAATQAARFPDSTPSSARAYLDQVLGSTATRASLPRAAPHRTQPRSRTAPAPPTDDAPGTPAAAPAAPEAPASQSTLTLPPSPGPAPPDLDAAPEPWRRVRLGEDAELLIREPAYQQHRDRVDWLIRWARRVFR